MLIAEEPLKKEEKINTEEKWEKIEKGKRYRSNNERHSLLFISTREGWV